MTVRVDVMVNTAPLDEAMTERAGRPSEALRVTTDPHTLGLIEKAVRHALADAAVSAAELSVTLLDDVAIQAMNREYLERDRVTDVIAFTLTSDDDSVGLMGDVYIGAEQAIRQAEQWTVPLQEEFMRLAIHGTLHVLGHDHPEGESRSESAMFRAQERLLKDVLATG